MSDIQVANAPCSWGVMRGFDAGQFPHFRWVLDEIAQSGYAGTELGDWGFLPVDADILRAELARRDLAIVGALVPVPFAERLAHAEGVAAALRTARLLASCPDRQPWGQAPFIILADDNGSHPVRTKFAGRIRPQQGLTPDQWRDFAEGVELAARAVRDETGLRTVFHHHCAGFVETPAETARLMELTDPGLVGLCFDTGHYAYAGGDPLDGLKCFGERVWHVHFKDCHPRIAERARGEGWDYFRAVRNGVFFGLGGGEVEFAPLLQELRRRGYRGWVVVEDELPPGAADAGENARRDREFLRGLGL